MSLVLPGITTLAFPEMSLDTSIDLVIKYISPQPDNMIHVAVLQVNMCAYPACYDGTAEWLNSLRPDVTEWCIDVSLDKAIIGSGNGLVLVWHQAIIWTNADSVWTGLQEMNLRKCLPNSWNKAIFFFGLNELIPVTQHQVT